MSQHPTTGDRKPRNDPTQDDDQTQDIARQASRSGQSRNRGGGPNVPAEKPLNFWPSLRRLLGLLTAFRWQMVAAVVLAAVGVVASVVGPFLMGRATDQLLAGVMGEQLAKNHAPGTPIEQVVRDMRDRGNDEVADMLAGMDVVIGQGVDFGALGRFLLLILGLYVASAIAEWLSGYLINKAVIRSVRDLRTDVENKIHRLPLKYFDTQSRGEVLSRVTNDLDNVSTVLQQSMMQLLTNVVTLVGVLAMMLWVSPLLTLIAVIVFPLSFVVTAFVAKRSQREFVAQWKHTGQLNSVVEETFTGHELVTVFGRRDDAAAQFAEHNAGLRKSSTTAQFVSGLIMPTMSLVSNISYVLVALVGALRITSGALTVGDVQAFIQYSRQLARPIGQVSSVINLVQSGIASAERVFSVLDAPEESVEPARSALPERITGRVEFQRVSFRYEEDTPLIEDLDLVAEPGSTVAIVGETGAGKTTLVNLLLRFYELRSGRILLDGVDISSEPRAALRSHFGMVLQDAWLFRGTIAENIAYGRPGATDEQVIEAAKATYVDRFVRHLPDGYDTVLEDDASNISLGERQLVTIARAFIAAPDVLVLDEATSSVDTRTEAQLQAAMNTLRTGRTSFVIAHRLSTIRDADQIVVMGDGQVLEQGSHEELLERGGQYARLYNSQFAEPMTDDTEDADAAAHLDAASHRDDTR